MDKRLENKFYRLFALKLSGEASAEELQELGTILEQYPELQFFYDELIKPVPKTGSAEQAALSYATHAASMYVREVLSEKQELPVRPQRNWSVKKITWWIAAAAILIAVVTGGVLWNRKPEGMPAARNEMATAKGSRSRVQLPDGTVVLLNANSRLSYNEKFKGDVREVSLLGEAYFDVTHDAARPFIIHTGAGNIKVLGTAFNVKAFDKGIFETTLIRGKVAVQLKDHSGEDFVLKPGQKLVASHNNDKTDSVMILPVTVKDSLIAETSWTKGRLVFVNRPLIEIMAELERVFGVTIEFKSEKTQQFRYTGVFDDTDLDQILEILKLSKPIKYQRDKNKIIIE